MESSYQIHLDDEASGSDLGEVLARLDEGNADASTDEAQDALAGPGRATTRARAGRRGSASGAQVDDLAAGPGYADTIRAVPLLTSEEELDLGRRVHEGRAAMAQALSSVPYATFILLDILDQAVAGSRPFTDALLAPFGTSEREQADDDQEGGASGEAKSRGSGSRRLHRQADGLRAAYEAWEEVARASLSRRRASARRLAEARGVLAESYRQLQPGVVGMRETVEILRRLEAAMVSGSAAGGALEGIVPDPVHLDGLDAATLERVIVDAEEAHRTYALARKRLVEANLRLAYYMARKVMGQGVTVEDLVQDAMLGLMRAVDKFDHRLGYRFSTYACQWIWQAVTRSIADSSRTIRIPAHMHETTVRLRKVSRQLTQKLGRDPSAEEISEASRVPMRKVGRALDASRPLLSLDAPVPELDDLTMVSCVADAEQPDPGDLVHDELLQEHMAGLLSRLGPREEYIIRMRFGVGVSERHTLEEVGRQLGITRERARQLEGRALTRLRSMVDGRLIESLGP